jgi:hypothetical protein
MPAPGPFAALMRLFANRYDGNVASHGQLIAAGLGTYSA